MRQQLTLLENPTIHGGGDIEENIFSPLEGGIQNSVPSSRVYFFGGTTASLQALAIRIFTTVLAGILICSPVAGLNPIRAFRLERTSLPIPGNVKTPAFLVSAMARAATSSSIIAAAFLGTSNLPAKWETIWDLVIGF